MDKDGKEDRKIGASAKRGMIMNPKNTVSFIKRFMGSEWNDKDVQKMLTMVTYDVVTISLILKLMVRNILLKKFLHLFLPKWLLLLLIIMEKK